MIKDGFTIARAIQSRSWPASSANLEFAAAWGTRDEVGEEVPRVADDVEVRRISPLVEAAGRVEGMPVRLKENLGIAFQGCIVLGSGFTLNPAEAQEWIAADARNAEVLFPYLNGQDLNSRPDSSPSRWVIDFGMREEAEAESYPIPYERVVQQVKPERAKVRIPYRRDFWWRFAAWAPSLRRAISEMSEVLVIARVSKTVMPLRVPTGQVMSEACVVFATDDYGEQAILSSSLHQVWAITYGSTLETRVRYTPSDVFETFPRPPVTDRLIGAGRSLNETRRDTMLRRNLGLTDLYNLVNDPQNQGDADVEKLRGLHAEIDAAVLNSFGWDDLITDPGFHEYRQVVRWTISPATRVEVLDRLLLENHHRAAGGAELEASPQAGGSNRRAAAEDGTLFG